RNSLLTVFSRSAVFAIRTRCPYRTGDALRAVLTRCAGRTTGTLRAVLTRCAGRTTGTCGPGRAFFAVRAGDTLQTLRAGGPWRARVSLGTDRSDCHIGSVVAILGTSVCQYQ